MQSDKIEITNLNKTFSGRVVLNNLSLTIKEKQSLVVLGRSGTGKSVLIKNISALMKPDSGSIKIDGVEITKLSDAKRLQLMNKFGFLFQGGALFDSMNIWENVAFKLLNQLHYSKKDARKIAIEKLELVDLGESVADLLPSELSGGMQKRVALARAIACNPSIIFFDEPTTGLDPVTAQTINELMNAVKKITGATAITITHDIKSALQIADRIVLLNNGVIEWDGFPDELPKCENELVKQFFL
jgi:phospholipid/cholesterol/gamma-HCH transport system ATP-binding protein